MYAKKIKNAENYEQSRIQTHHEAHRVKGEGRSNYFGLNALWTEAYLGNYVSKHILKPTLQDSINLPLRTLTTQRNAATPHVTNLRLLASLRITNRAFDTHSTLEMSLQSNKTNILLHSLGDTVPESRVQRSILVPPRRWTVRITSRVFEAVRRSCFTETRVFRDITEERVCLVDVEVSRVNLVEAEAAVHVCQRCDAGSDPASGEGGVCILNRAVVSIVDHELVLVVVAEEYVGDDVWGVAVYDLVEEVCWVWDWVAAIPAAGDVTNQPDAFVRVLGFLELLDHPGEDP